MALWFPLVACLHVVFAGTTLAGLILLVLWTTKQSKEMQSKTITWLLIVGIIGIIATTLFMGYAHSQDGWKGDIMFPHMQEKRLFMKDADGNMMMQRVDKMDTMRTMPLPAASNTNTNAPAVNANTNK